MFARAILVVAASTLLAACVDSNRLRNNLGRPPAATEVEQNPTKQTLSSKVLGAIALERVTGRKADPVRLKQLR
jgi:hypothetical protein